MPEEIVSVVNPLGMHARAAARFVKTADRYRASVRVSRSGTTIDGKSILGLLFLAASEGSRLRISTSGPEAGSALRALVRLVRSGIGDPELPGPSGTADPGTAPRPASDAESAPGTRPPLPPGAAPPPAGDSPRGSS